MRRDDEAAAAAGDGREQRVIDWARVARATYQVRQHYRYTYSGPITDLKQQLLMIPPLHHGDQHLLGRQLEVRGTTGKPTIRWESDRFGNRLCRVFADRVEHAVDFEATDRVERSAHPTPLPHPDDRLRDAAATIAGRASGARERAELAGDWAAGAITYQFGV